jgi:Spy/CpxP family protein refolding chaperone
MMARHTVWRFAAMLAGSAPATADELHCIQVSQHQKPTASKDQAKGQAPAHQDDRWKWWLYDRAELGISEQQSAQINQIFESTVPTLREMRKNVDALEEALSKTIHAYTTDVASLSQQIDKVDKARNEYSKTRSLMLYKIQLVLTPDQRAKVKALRERREAERRKDNKDSDHRR